VGNRLVLTSRGGGVLISSPCNLGVPNFNFFPYSLNCGLYTFTKIHTFLFTCVYSTLVFGYPCGLVGGV